MRCRHVQDWPAGPVYPGSFGDCGREILAIAHGLMGMTRQRHDGALYVTRIAKSNSFLVTTIDDRYPLRLAVDWNPRWGWVFQDIGTRRGRLFALGE